MKLFVSILLLSLSAAAATAEEGWFGFSQQVRVGWTMNVESATVNHVEKESPAAKAGIAVGDQFLSIDNCAIPGCGAFKAKKLMEKTVGETLNLKLKRSTGEEYSVSLVAERSPSK